MSTWTEIESIFEHMRTLMETYCTELQHNTRSWVHPGLSVDNDPSNADIRRVILGKKGYADMQFPSCYVVLTSIRFEVVSFSTENVNLNFRIITVNKDEPSFWGSFKKSLEVSCNVKDALYNKIGTHNKRTLLSSVNDCFAEEILTDTDPEGATTAPIWNFFTFRARKKISV